MRCSHPHGTSRTDLQISAARVFTQATFAESKKNLRAGPSNEYEPKNRQRERDDCERATRGLSLLRTLGLSQSRRDCTQLRTGETPARSL